jgi:hypothetical protein
MDEQRPIFHAPKIWVVKRGLVWPIRIILYLVASYFLYKFYVTYTSGIVYSRRNSYTVEEAPIFWGIMLILYFLVVVGSIWQSFRVKTKT